jgi:hypothetical protein
MTVTAEPELLIYCIKVLRTVCASEDETEAFNRLMSDLKCLQGMQMIPAQSWQSLKQHNILPISQKEAADGVPIEQQDSFY